MTIAKIVSVLLWLGVEVADMFGAPSRVLRRVVQQLSGTRKRILMRRQARGAGLQLETRYVLHTRSGAACSLAVSSGERVLSTGDSDKRSTVVVVANDNDERDGGSDERHDGPDERGKRQF